MIKIFGWGENEYSQIADIENKIISSPREITNQLPKKPISQIVSAADCFYILTADGKVIVSGKSNINEEAKIYAPMTLFGEERIVQLSTFSSHLLALTADNRVLATGKSKHGQLGVPPESMTTTTYVTVELPLSSAKVVQISAGDGHSLALLDDGSVLSWGNNYYLQLGRPTQLNYCSTPTVIPALKEHKVVKIASGAFFSGAITDNGQVLLWGKNDYGQLGQRGAKGLPAVAKLDFFMAPPVACDLALGDSSTFVVTKEGKVLAFGSNMVGNLGIGMGLSMRVVHRPTEILLSSDIKVAKLSTGYNHSLLVTDDNQVYAFGDNAKGALGIGNELRKKAPCPVPFLNYDGKLRKTLSVVAAGAQSFAFVLIYVEWRGNMFKTKWSTDIVITSN